MDPLIANFRYASVSRVILAPGTYDVGALYTDGNDSVVFPGAPGNTTTISGVTYNQATFVPGGSLADPTTSLGQSTGYFGPNVLAGSVPEPASWALMLIGLGGLGAALRSRRGQVAALA